MTTLGADRRQASLRTRILSENDAAEALALLAENPVATAFVAARIEVHGLVSWKLGAQVWGWPHAGPLQALCWSGANLIPLGAGSRASDAFAARAASQGRICSSIVGPSESVLRMWQRLEPAWGAAREVRSEQPLLQTRHPAQVPSDPRVRPATESDVEALIPASVAMYTEEVGVSPLGSDGGAAYRGRVSELVNRGRTYIRREPDTDGTVVFKAELGAVTSRCAQVQGVWVDPAWRGRGIATAATAAVIDQALAHVAPTVSLYVNNFNTPARAVYERCGMRQVGSFATVLF